MINPPLSQGAPDADLFLAQLQKVFTLDYRSPGFDWTVLRVALETLELYLTRLDEASEEQYSSEFAGDFDPAQLEEATLVCPPTLKCPALILTLDLAAS